MRVLLLGSGGRESALGAGLARSPSVTELISAPGNPGLARLGPMESIDINSSAEVTELSRRLGADLVVIGPEAPLTAGVADTLRDAGHKVFGPVAAAARIEGSKSYAKELMDRAGIATERWQSFEDHAKAVAYLDELGPPYVVKANGLAAGKGVVVTEDRGAAIDALEACLVRGRFGAAGSKVVIEEFLDGPEVSLIAITDGRTALLCEPAQDYKRAFDEDAGPNTGGMGSYSPVPACPAAMAQTILEEVIEPVIRATAAEQAPFSGALFAGLALTSRGPRVVEFNARFGDPETQALIPRLASDLGEICMAAASGELAGTRISWRPERCVAVVLASGGYPGEYETGFEIEGVDKAEGLEGVEVFHAGTTLADGRLRTAGGRVLAVAALGATFDSARRRAYEAATSIHFEGQHQRSDIAERAAIAEAGS